MIDDDKIEALKALAHPVRYLIFSTLAKGEQNVGEIEQASGVGQPALSQQLAVLRQAGLVDTRRDGKLVYYRLDRATFVQILDMLKELLGEPVETEKSNVASNLTGVARFARLT